LLVALGASVLVVSASLGGSSSPVATRRVPVRLSPARSAHTPHVDLRGRAYVPGQILVRFRTGESQANVDRAISRLGGTTLQSFHIVPNVLLASHNPSWDWRTLGNLVISGGDPNPATFGLTISGRRINAQGSLTCSGTKVFAALRPLERTHTRPQGIAALNIRCGDPAGPQSVTITPGGETITLADDGAGATSLPAMGSTPASGGPAPPGRTP
jgi:hypothetical protein